MPIAFYTISVTWNDKKLYSAGHMVNTKDTMSIPIVYHAKAPKATFVEPKGPTIPHMNIKFIGEGNDTEDGALPDSMLVWRSSVDGELGRGSTITVDGLSSGSHTISLEVTDSDGKTDIVEKRFTVLTYDSASYFPIANYAGWTYVNKPKVIIMTTEEGDEEWELGDIHVEIGEENTRISSMEYRRTIGGKKKQYSYVVTDWLKYDGQKVLVWKTHELLSVKTQYSPLQVLNVTSVYTPHYPLISDVFNVRTMPVIDQTFNVNTTWKLRSGFVREFTESFSSHVHVEPEGTEKLITPFGTTETVIIRIEQHNSLRRWWLSPGTGIVKMTHNMFNPMVEAVLFATNLDSFRETERGMRPIAGKASTTLVSPPVHDKIPDDLYRSLTIGRMFHPFRQPAFPDENSFELQD